MRPGRHGSARSSCSTPSPASGIKKLPKALACPLSTVASQYYWGPKTQKTSHCKEGIVMKKSEINWRLNRALNLMTPDLAERSLPAACHSY